MWFQSTTPGLTAMLGVGAGEVGVTPLPVPRGRDTMVHMQEWERAQLLNQTEPGRPLLFPSYVTQAGLGLATYLRRTLVS